MVAEHTDERRRWMGVLAMAKEDDLTSLWHSVASRPTYAFLRRPEIGLVMMRARIGGDGEEFNLGELTATRCSVRLAEGMVGHATLIGRRPDQAEMAAVLDAMLQDDNRRPALEAQVIAPLEQLQQERRTLASRKAAATRADFFTMVRGED
jgi:alpha-D-ribose 1-methylphosphonate 5-triphosphate synthase subunit PhnG